jgi:hypothetical protein
MRGLESDGLSDPFVDESILVLALFGSLIVGSLLF